ncbi:MAG: hypothetical protein A3F13_04535 [Gammaproteobacteria bacterium RIFCSPHIGHO2_12_FULL_40_19]|nr:MAG: hypothetical protein A3F13_04535 [Gammaproteobacteria bacterium RIFCSPHIGHO2_12_FULL_40_19]
MKIKQHQQGSVIIEVLIASLIFAIAMLSLVAFQTNLLRERTIVNQKTEALSLVQDKMQYFRSYTALTNAPAGIAYSDITTNGSPTNVAATTATYTLSWQVTDATSPTRKAVVISAEWTDPTGSTNTVSISSIIASIDPQATGKVSQNLP